jgi:hypothetical protein
MIFQINLLFLLCKLLIMAQEEVIDNHGKDIAHSWVSTSRFLFYCQVAVFVALVIGGCYTMYVHRYKGKPNVEVPGNTQYNPQYK